MKLTPDDFDKLHTKKVANIIRKLGAGKTLTKREEEILEQEKSRGDADQNTDANFAGNWDELAKMLSDRSGVSITRRAIQEWRRDPRYEDKYPEPRPDGRHDVNAWIVFMRRFGLKAADEVVDPDEIPEERRTTADWKNYREELGCREAERRIARGDNLLLVATELEVPMGATFVTINSKLAQFPGRAARFMVMKRDEAEAEQTLRDEIDAVLLDLNLANYIDTSIGAVVSEFPFDPETEELYKRVSFSGQDHDALKELIRLSVTETLRRIGRRAVQSADNQSISSEPQQNEPSDVAPEATNSRACVRDSAEHGNKSPSISAPSDLSQPRSKPRAVTPARKRGGKISSRKSESKSPAG